MSCGSPLITAGDGIKITGEYLNTNLGQRMTLTSRRLLVPDKAWNEPLTPGELKTVKQTWHPTRVCVPPGMTSRLFAGGLKQGSTYYDHGVLMTLYPGEYQFEMQNGEVVIWYQEQEANSANDLDRIIRQIQNGNFDIKGPLDFFGVTADLLPQIPKDLVKLRNVQIIWPPQMIN